MTAETTKAAMAHATTMALRRKPVLARSGPASGKAISAAMDPWISGVGMVEGFLSRGRRTRTARLDWVLRRPYEYDTILPPHPHSAIV